MAESMMSEASHSEMSSMSGMSEAGSGEKKGDSMVAHIVIALVLLLLVFVSIYFLGVSGSSEVETTAGEAVDSGGGSGGGGGGGGGGSIFSHPASPPRPLTTTAESASKGNATGPGVASPTSPKPGTTTPSSTTPTPPPPTATLPPAKLPMLACTVGHQAVILDLVPPDGTCDNIFYTDVFFNDKNNKIEPLYSDTAFKVVRSAAATYSKTTFGTSMYPGAIGQLLRGKQRDIESAMTTLFNENFVHFGMLNVDNIEDYDKLKDGPLQYLRIVGDFLTTPGHLCALGVGLFNGSQGTLILEKAKLATQHFPKITMIVIKVHTERAGTLFGRYPVAPNPDGVDNSDYDTLSLRLLGDNVQQHMQELADNNRRYALLSFAMFARAYRLPKVWTSARTRDIPALQGVIMEYRMVCRHSNIVKDPLDSRTSYVANTTTKFVALFDTAQNVKDKIASRKKHDIPAKFGGIMAYRVDMDDYAGSCGEGVFPRLKALKSELLK